MATLTTAKPLSLIKSEFVDLSNNFVKTDELNEKLTSIKDDLNENINTVKDQADEQIGYLEDRINITKKNLNSYIKDEFEYKVDMKELLDQYALCLKQVHKNLEKEKEVRHVDDASICKVLEHDMDSIRQDQQYMEKDIENLIKAFRLLFILNILLWIAFLIFFL